MQKGDIIICKKEFTSKNSWGCKFIVDNKYNIGDFSWTDNYHIEIYDDNPHNSWSFSIVEGSKYYIWDYFISEKELRKLKLDEIEGKK